MGVDELTQKFKLKGEICPKSDTSKRWRILDAYPISYKSHTLTNNDEKAKRDNKKYIYPVSQV